MGLFEVLFKVTHDCPLCKISKEFPSLKMYSWCNREHEVYEMVVENQAEYTAVVEEMAKLADIIEASSDGHKVHFIAKPCSCASENSVSKNIDEFDLLHVSPVVYEQGWEYYRLIAFRHDDVSALMMRLEAKGFTFEILRKVPFDGFIASSLTLNADTLFSNLTEKQIEALLTAYNQGYYRLPRASDVKTIASRKHVPRTTYQEHLKKAENKLVASLIPYIQLSRLLPPERRNQTETK